jgi:hypothetical protein
LANKEEITISRLAMYALWVTAIASVVAAAVSWVGANSSRQASQQAQQAVQQDDLAISNPVRISSAPTRVDKIMLSENGTVVTTGVATVYWQFTITNNGDHDAWLVEYYLKSLSTNYPNDYTGMDQGIFMLKDDTLVPTSIPIVVKSESTIVLYSAIGLLMNSDSYAFVAGQFEESDNRTLSDLNLLLSTEGVDLYSNPVQSAITGMLTYVYPSQVKEQSFIVWFYTSRGLQQGRLTSWYAHNGLREGRVQ